MLKKFRQYAYRLFHPDAQEWKQVHTLYHTFASSPEGRHILHWRNAQKLHRFVVTHGIRRALELGTGIGASTAIIANALPPEGTLITVEQREKCVRVAQALIPPALKKKITFVHSEPRACCFQDLSPYLYFSTFKHIPAARELFDFVFVDGPTLWKEGGQCVVLPNGDLIHLIPRIAPGGWVVIDGRKPAVRLYERFLSHYFTFEKENARYTLLRRTDYPVREDGTLDIVDREAEKEHYEIT